MDEKIKPQTKITISQEDGITISLRHCYPFHALC